MAQIISVHSFRGGTGKSNTSANIASLIAASGKRVAIIDTDINSPGIHILFGVTEDQVKFSLNDYLWGKCEIKDTCIDVSEMLKRDPNNRVSILSGKLYLIPASMRVGEIAQIIREGYDVGLLNAGVSTGDQRSQPRCLDHRHPSGLERRDAAVDRRL